MGPVPATGRRAHRKILAGVWGSGGSRGGEGTVVRSSKAAKGWANNSAPCCDRARSPAARPAGTSPRRAGSETACVCSLPHLAAAAGVPVTLSPYATGLWLAGGAARRAKMGGTLTKMEPGNEDKQSQVGAGGTAPTV